jgi:hypothetical protein
MSLFTGPFTFFLQPSSPSSFLGPSEVSGNFTRNVTNTDEHTARVLAYGWPSILTLFIFLQLGIAFSKISKYHRVSDAFNTFASGALYLASLCNILLGLALLWSPIWSYGLAIAVFSIAALGMSIVGARRSVKALIILMALWVVAVIGYPRPFGPGAVAPTFGALPFATTGDNCPFYYTSDETRDVMCDPDWNTAIFVIATTATGLAGLMLLSLLSMLVDPFHPCNVPRPVQPTATTVPATHGLSLPEANEPFVADANASRPLAVGSRA